MLQIRFRGFFRHDTFAIHAVYAYISDVDDLCVMSCLMWWRNIRSYFHKTKNRNNAETGFAWESKPEYISVNKEDLKFMPSEYEVVYFEREYCKELNEIISSHFAEFAGMAESHGVRFIYLPEYNKGQSGHDYSENVSYLNPAIYCNGYVPEEFLTYQDIAAAYNVTDEIKVPCLLRCMSRYDDTGYVRFSIRRIESLSYESFAIEFPAYLGCIYHDHIRFRMMTDEEYERYMSQFTADERFDDDILRIGGEIRSKIKELESRGLSSLVIRKLVGEVPDRPGRLFIDASNRIFLPDFNNMEIKLSPIQKTVYFLFLRHPEGIYFKDLADYKDELYEIYSSISGRTDADAMAQSIDRLTDPYDNSINEKCARIRMAFVSSFSDELAGWYYIDGRKGDRKCIRLPRELVIVANDCRRR